MSMQILNKEYWKKIPAGETTSVEVTISDSELNMIPHGGHVLDIGCGDGQLAEYLTQKGFAVEAIDINHNVIQANQAKQSDVQYSLQDIAAGKTNFADGMFDLLCFKYTLANIHREEWPLVRDEVARLIKPKGFVWIAEPLISPDYQERYALAKELLDDEHALFVFKNPEQARLVQTSEQMQKAIANDEISRISRHFEKTELTSQLFPSFTIIKERINEIPSPSGFTIRTLVALLQHTPN